MFGRWRIQPNGCSVPKKVVIIHQRKRLVRASIRHILWRSLTRFGTRATRRSPVSIFRCSRHTPCDCKGSVRKAIPFCNIDQNAQQSMNPRQTASTCARSCHDRTRRLQTADGDTKSCLVPQVDWHPLEVIMNKRMRKTTSKCFLFIPRCPVISVFLTLA